MESRIKEIFIQLGAELCGVFGEERFHGFPKGHSPQDVLPECRSVVVFVKAMPKGLQKVEPDFLYRHFNLQGPVLLDEIAAKGALALEREWNATALPIPADDPVGEWNEERLEARGILSLKHMAVLGGLGTLGKSTLLLTPEYGNWVNVGAVLTDLPLKSDSMLTESICIEGCSYCIDHCPTGAITQEGTVVQKLCRRGTGQGKMQPLPQDVPHGTGKTEIKKRCVSSAFLMRCYRPLA